MCIYTYMYMCIHAYIVTHRYADTDRSDVYIYQYIYSDASKRRIPHPLSQKKNTNIYI